MLSRIRASEEEGDQVNTGAVFLLLIIHWASRQPLPIHFHSAVLNQPIMWLGFRDFLANNYQPISGKLLSEEKLRLLETKAVFFLKNCTGTIIESSISSSATCRSVPWGTLGERLVVWLFEECKIRRIRHRQKLGEFQQNLFRSTALGGSMT